MQRGDLAVAEERLERVVKLAPAYPNGYYLLGMLFEQRADAVRARTFFEKTIGLDPSHTRALLFLGRLHYQQKRPEEAIRVLEQALALDNLNWNGHWILGGAHFARQQYERARLHAERAAQLAGSKAPQIALLLAQSLHKLGETALAVATVDEFLRGFPEHAAAPIAREILSEMRATPPPPDAAGAPADSASPPAIAPAAGEPEAGADIPAAPAASWAPADLDAAMPPVDPAISCSLPEVLQSAALQVRRLVENLQGVTAREIIETEEFDRSGRAGTLHSQTFEHMTTIREPKPGVLFVEEDRRALGEHKLSGLPLASEGLPALALVFHPYYSVDYEMKCEGLGQVTGQPAWQIYFRQRTERPPRIRVFHTREGRFPLALKGRAWIGAGNHQILRLETEMIEPLREAPLESERIVIVYAPAHFAQRDLRLWLPLKVDLYAHLRGRRHHMRHSFSGFTYFAVDVKQKIHDPKVDEKKKPPKE